MIVKTTISGGFSESDTVNLETPSVAASSEVSLQMSNRRDPNPPASLPEFFPE